jgi:hypothetical protein
MLVKHISRVSKEEEAAKKQLNQNISAEDEWSHITEAGPKIDIQDPLDVSQRSIFFSKNQQASTKQEIVQEKAEEVKDQINNTNQYQKFVNVLLKERMNDLKKMLDKEKQFAQELSCFQDTTKSRVDLEKVNPKYITENDTKSLIVALESEHDQMKERLDHEQSVIEKTRNELQIKKQQIEQLKNELPLIAQKQKSQDNVDPVAMIKHELQKLGIKDDTGKIATALELLANKTKRDTNHV